MRRSIVLFYFLVLHSTPYYCSTQARPLPLSAGNRLVTPSMLLQPLTLVDGNLINTAIGLGKSDDAAALAWLMRVLLSSCRRPGMGCVVGLYLAFMPMRSVPPIGMVRVECRRFRLRLSSYYYTSVLCRYPSSCFLCLAVSWKCFDSMLLLLLLLFFVDLGTTYHHTNVLTPLIKH